MVLLKNYFNAKITEMGDRMPSITGFTTNSALTAKKKIPDVSGLVKKTDYNTEFSEIENRINDYDHDK